MKIKIRKEICEGNDCRHGIDSDECHALKCQNISVIINLFLVYYHEL